MMVEGGQDDDEGLVLVVSLSQSVHHSMLSVSALWVVLCRVGGWHPRAIPDECE
jgi:hypothetical protein